MANVIITKLEQRNKELLEENENLKKQLADKKENFTTKNLKCSSRLTESSEYTGTALRTLERFTGVDKSGVSYPEKNRIEIGGVVLALIFTPENIVKFRGV